ncbi:uncharacterized protein LOC125014017 [Mugil cephalus]|uniref:uncharacterized protein LOC125014017 n=1 Tax=Mugil cephalus TaxID=48193 RepID=UPI001FB5D7BF|nr:uncharacterized protein LOC125014017 [Mugil cephalus]
MMEDEGAVVEEVGASLAQSPLVAVTFQKNAHRKEKFLEAEPKALGITQICLSLYNITGAVVLQTKGLGHIALDIPYFILSLLVLIAGAVAISAQNLHLSTLRACLGMEILASGASIINFAFTVVKMGDMYYYCWHYETGNNTEYYRRICEEVQATQSHFHAGGMLVQVTLLALSITLASYCCKVINCCGPAPNVPVIMIQTPPPQQSGTEE